MPRRRIPGQALAVEDRPVEIELLAQLDLPLLEHGLRREDQNSLCAPREPCLPQHHPRFDRLTEADLVGDQELRRPMIVQSVERANLMRPRRDRARRFADTLAAVRQGRGVVDEPPDEATQVDRRTTASGLRRAVRTRAPAWLRHFDGCSLSRRASIIGGRNWSSRSFTAVGTSMTIAVDRSVRPQPREGRLLVLDMRLGARPIGEDVEALPVVAPALQPSR